MNNFNTQHNESWNVYDDSDVAIIKISLDPADFQFMNNKPGSENDYLQLGPSSF